MKPSPFAPETFASLPPLTGVRLAAAEAGIRYKNRKDVLLVLLPGGHAGGWRSDALEDIVGPGRLVPAAIGAWAGAGAGGEFRQRQCLYRHARLGNGRDHRRTGGQRARRAGRRRSSSRLPASSASRSPPGKFEGVLERLAGEAVEDGFADAARTIMTTDTFPKLASRTTEIGGVTVTLNGIAKGSGMIAPDMATMLAFIFTDAAVGARPRCRRC